MAAGLVERVRRALAAPPPAVGEVHRLWLVGTGPYHDAAELGTHPFAGSGRSVAAVAGEGHQRMGELLSPQDCCVLVGGDPELRRYTERVARGVGAGVFVLAPVAAGPPDPAGSTEPADPTASGGRAGSPASPGSAHGTTTFAVTAVAVLALVRSLDAPGVTANDLAALPDAIAEATSGHPPLTRDSLGPRVLMMGSGPAAVTARHLATVLRGADRSVAVEGLDAQDVPGLAARLLGPGTTVVALDSDRDPEAPVTHMARMAAAEGATVIPVPAPRTLSPVAAQIPLAVATARGLRI